MTMVCWVNQVCDTNFSNTHMVLMEPYSVFMVIQRIQLMDPFRGAATTPLQDAWNKSMSQSRTSVENIFGGIIIYFKFLEFKKGLKLQLSAFGKKHIVCAIMQNGRVCLYSN